MEKLATCLIHKNTFFYNRRYTLMIFVFLFIGFLALTPKTLSSPFVTTHYLLNYEFGFASRSLVGTVFLLFTDKITLQMIYVSGIISFLFLSFLISLLLGKMISNASADLKSDFILFSVLFLASPLSVTYLLGFHFARLDDYWIILTLLALVFLKKPVLRWSVPLLCALAVSTHHGYMVTYMPALAIPLFYEIYKSKYSKKNVVIFGLSCSSMIILFTYFQFLQENIPYDNAVDFANHLSQHADFKAYAPMVYLEYFATLSEWFNGFVLHLTRAFALPVSIVLFAFSLPLLIIFGVVWKNSFCHTEHRFLRLVFSLCAFAPLAFIPAAIFGNDWDRWWAAVINNQFILIFYFAFSNEKSVIESIKKVGNYFRKHFLLLLMIIVFTNSLTFSESATLVLIFINNNADLDVFSDYLKELLTIY